MIRLYLAFLLILVSSFAVGCRAEIAAPPPIILTPTSAPLPSPTLARATDDVIVVSPTFEPTLIASATISPSTSPEILPPTPLIILDPTTPALPPSFTPCAEAGRIESGQLESAVAGEPMRYRVYLPPCYGQDGFVYPVLYMFGGNIHNDAIWDTLGLDESAESLIINGGIPPLLIVMPDNGWLANTTTSGPTSYEGFVLGELIPHIEGSYCAWPDAAGRAVGGLSRGGYWSLMMAFRRPDLFRSVAAHSPALIDSHAGPAEDPVVTGATNDLGNLRIWVDIGERDPYLNEARPLHDALVATAVDHEWHINEGTHEEAYWRANLANYLIWFSEGWRIERPALPACTIQ